MINEFQRLIIAIDQNIQNKKIYDDPLLLKNTTELLSSANLVLSKQKNIHNDYFQNEILENCFNELKKRKNIIDDIIQQYKIQIQKKKIEETDSIIEEKKNQFDIDLNRPYELSLLTNLNESLLSGSIKNLNNIHNNLEISSQSLKDQGGKINNIYKESNLNESHSEFGSKLLDSIYCNQKCKKYILMIINIL